MAKGVYYKTDDEKKHFKRASKTPKPTKLRSSIQPGQVLILLAGRFKGRRVVFLKQLPSGLLLVTGPYKVNGVPLKRVCQSSVIPTSTKVDVSKLDSSKVDDSYFANTSKNKQTVKSILESGLNRDEKMTEEEKSKLKKKFETQLSLDKALVESLKKDKMVAKYMATRFTLRKNLRPHELKF